MNWDRSNQILTATARIAVGAIFVYAGAGKFLADSAGPTMFTEFFPNGSIGGYVAASAEVVLGLWLVSGFLKQWSAGVAMATLLFFSGLIVREMNKPDPNPCGCIREVLPGDVLVDRAAEVRRRLRISLGRNAALMGCAAMTLLSVPRRPPATSGPDLHPTDDPADGDRVAS